MRNILLLLATVIASSTQATEMYVITQNGQLFRVSDANGVRTMVDQFSFTSVTGLAYSTGDQKFYFIDNQNLYSFSLGAQPVFSRALNFTQGSIQDIAIDRSGIVWGQDQNRNLWRFGRASGETLIGTTTHNSGLQLDFGVDGSLYAWNKSAGSDSGIYVINQTTAEETLIGLGPTGNGCVFAIPTTEAYSGYVLDFNATEMRRADLSNGAITHRTNVTATLARGAAYDTPLPFRSDVSLGTVNFGRVDQNPIGCLRDRDSSVLRVCKFIVPNQTVAPIQFEMNINGVSGQSIFGYFFKGRMTASGAFSCQIQIKRLSDGVYDTLDQRNLGATFATYFKNTGSMVPYFNSNGDATMRVVVRPSGPVSQPSFCLELDQFAVSMD